MAAVLQDHDGHGPEFHKHMYRINQATGTRLLVAPAGSSSVIEAKLYFFVKFVVCTQVNLECVCVCVVTFSIMLKWWET